MGNRIRRFLKRAFNIVTAPLVFHVFVNEHLASETEDLSYDSRMLLGVLFWAALSLFLSIPLTFCIVAPAIAVLAFKGAISAVVGTIATSMFHLMGITALFSTVYGIYNLRSTINAKALEKYKIYDDEATSNMWRNTESQEFERSASYTPYKTLLNRLSGCIWGMPEQASNPEQGHSLNRIKIS